MQAKELMPCDIMMRCTSTGAEPRQISYLDGCHIVFPFNERQDSADPVPITEDFLLKNLFVKSCKDGQIRYTRYIDKQYGWYIRVWATTNHFMMTNIIFHKHKPYPHDGKLLDAFQYVHELQHALRVCGLTHMANTFTA